jgi:hypothetical protein
MKFRHHDVRIVLSVSCPIGSSPHLRLLTTSALHNQPSPPTGGDSPILLAAGPIGFQYGAEVAYPAPEGTTNGLLLMIGQVSGILFILAMDAFKSPASGSMTPALVVLIGLMAVGALLSTRLRESGMITDRS